MFILQTSSFNSSSMNSKKLRESKNLDTDTLFCKTSSFSTQIWTLNLRNFYLNDLLASGFIEQNCFFPTFEI